MGQELRLGLRRLRRNPAVSLTVILTLAVGVGAVTAAFTLVHGVLSPLQYPEPDRLVGVYQTLSVLKDSLNPRLAALWNKLPVSYQDAVDWRRNVRTLDGIGLFTSTTAVVEPGGEPLEVPAAQVDVDLLRVLGAKPALGRLFTAADVESRQPLALLGHDLWTSAFGADPKIAGRAVRVDGKLTTIVGVMPSGFGLPGIKSSLWTPAVPTEIDLTVRDSHAYNAVGRLAPGATLEAARAEMERLAAGLAVQYPDTNKDAGVRLVPLLDTVAGDSRRMLALLAAAALAVLLIACVNLAHVLLAQGLERQGETAMRLALGARRSHLLRQSAAETLWLGLFGSAGGLLLAVLARRALPLFLVTELPRLDEIRIDGTVLLFAIAAGFATALLSALAPAFLTTRSALRQAFSERRSVRLLQDGLVVAEVALTLILTAGALALVMSWIRLSRVDPGFDARDILTQEIHLPAWSYPDEARRRDFSTRALAGLEALPGADGAALTSRLPVAGPVLVGGFRIAGQDAPGGNWVQGRIAVLQFATPSFFRLLQIPVLAGRLFEDRPGTDSPKVVMVSRTLAERNWPGRSPVGAAVLLRDTPYRVEGVFPAIRNQGLIEEPGDLMVQPWSQGSPESFSVLVRFPGRPLDHLNQALDQAAADVRGALRRLDPSLPLQPAALLEDLVAQSAVGSRARALLVGLSAGVALLLALIGTYGVMAYGVGRRRREIAIRMATGAGRGWVQRWVLRRALTLALLGAGLGVLGSLAAGRLLAGLLAGAQGAGPWDLAAAAFLLIAACLAAAWVPARRAARVDPAAALRGE
jgi:predicted permease